MFQWTPEGRRLITGASSGEFTLWNGLTFNFETILQVRKKTVVIHHNVLPSLFQDRCGVSFFVFKCKTGVKCNKFDLVCVQAHDTSVRAMVWSHNDMWMLTADHAGFLKYWQSNMNNVKVYQAHKDPVRGLR